MSKLRSRGIIVLCLLANAIFASPQFHSSIEHSRHPRHASCPSCHRERPDALVSWITPPRRDYRDHETESDPWQVNQPFRTGFPAYQSQYNVEPYNRALRSRGASTISGSGGTCKREDPFTFGRNLDFDLVTPQTSSVRNLASPITPYRPHMPIIRSPPRTFYRKPNFYDLTKSQSDSVSTNRFLNYGLTNNEPHFENIKRITDPSDRNEKDYRVIYRADKYPDQSYEEEVPPISQHEYYPQRIQMQQRRMPVQMQVQEENQFVQRQREDNPTMVYEPEIKHTQYNLPSDVNLYRMMQNVGRDNVEVVNSTRWQNVMEGRDRQEADSFVARQIVESEKSPPMTRISDEMNVRQQNNGHLNYNDEDRFEDARRQIAEPSKSPEEISTQTTMQYTEKATRSSPVVMQIPRKVTSGV